MLQECLEICLLPDFLEERETNLGVINGNVARPEYGTTFFLSFCRP